ncbi:MAG TPA: imidazole glycerol phosphate synthase subunit HisF [Chitinophagaceae bacterium]|nr:imidazole glycerol phosphate synthase subunit HisF [Chitinophagaceae bacterium]
MKAGSVWKNYKKSIINKQLVFVLAKRIIPCLDIKNGRTVKGTNFLNLRDAGDPVELALRYCQQQADELLFLDITATNEKRKTLLQLVREIARHINIPFTVGGGINTIDDVNLLLDNGADKISVNTSAVNNPGLINELAKNFGSQCIVLAIDAKLINEKWIVVTYGGRNATELPVLQWAKEATERGAGEILLTSMDHDGTKQGFAVDITKEVSSLVPVPVIASGGAGAAEDFAAIFLKGEADAALAASIFHFNEIDIGELKKYLITQNIPIRI